MIFIDYISLYFGFYKHAIITAGTKMDKVYLDYAATTPVDPIVVQSMLPYFTDTFGNPSSLHIFGQRAENELTKSRNRILELLNANNADLIFTSGGTESDNLVLRGSLDTQKLKPEQNLVISPLEHPAIAATCAILERNVTIKQLRVDKYGFIDCTDLLSSIDGKTRLVSVIWANNEIGTINDIQKIGNLCAEKGVSFHTDGVQGFAYLNIDWTNLNIDFLSFGAHKFYGPKGVGGLIIKKGAILNAIQTGGSQESSMRAGTQNLPLIIGMTKAYELVCESRDILTTKYIKLRNMIIEEVIRTIPGAYLTGHPEKRLPNHASFVFEGIHGQDLVIGLDIAGFAVSSGSACKVGNPSPSQVLLSIGIPEDLARGALRVTVGRATTEEQIQTFLYELRRLVNQLRK